MTDQPPSLRRDGLQAHAAEGVVLTPAQLRSRRNRNIAIGIAVGFFVLLFYVVTIAKMGPGVLKSPT